MSKNGFLKAALFLALFTALAAGASAQITISGGFALSKATLEGEKFWVDVSQEDSIGYGGNVYLDYLLPIGIPLSLGVEAGFDGASTTASSDQWEDEIRAIPLLARVAYHFDLLPKLDLYIVGKVGYALGKWSGDTYDFFALNDEYNRNFKVTDPSGFAFGFDVGAAFYFTSRLGVFIEGGFDKYSLASEVTGEVWDGDSSYGSWINYKEEVELPFTRFFTAGLSLKF
jgi:opacity protein-like surface antigen